MPKSPFLMEPPSDFEVVPPGDHDAVIVAIFDVGKQESNYDGETKYNPQFVIAVELGIPRSDGRPHYMLTPYNRAWHPDCYWRKMCETVVGRTFGEKERFDARELLGKKCTAVVTETKQQRGRYENTYAKLELLREPSKGNNLLPACEPFVWTLSGYFESQTPLPDHWWIDELKVFGKTLEDMVRLGVANANKQNSKPVSQPAQSRKPQRSASRSQPDQYTRSTPARTSVPDDEDDSDIPF
jgi:hypothetical protein